MPLTFYFLLLLELDLLLDFFVVVFVVLDFAVDALGFVELFDDFEAVDLDLVLFAADSVFAFGFVDLAFAVEAGLAVVFFAAGLAVVFFSVDLVVVFSAVDFDFSAVFLAAGVVVFAAVVFGAALVSFFGSSVSSFLLADRAPIESINTRV